MTFHTRWRGYRDASGAPLEPRIIVENKDNPHKRRSLDQVCLGQNTRRQNGVDQFVLRQSFGLRCCLQVLVRDMEVAVPQVVADRELMFAHLRQHGSNRVSKSVPAHARDSDSSERRLNLLL